jgi:radical SAM superfamily enzyme YgiQ (UPF0313 family)
MIKGKGYKARGNKELLSGERGTIFKKWRGKVPVCIAYPNSYYIGMSNLATHILYKTLNGMPEVACERCFFEEGSDTVSLESGRPLSAFRLIFFTCSFELDYTNIVKMLSLSSVTLLSRERKESEPIVIAGGICVMANPEPLAGFMDLLAMGDIESTVPALMDTYLGMERSRRGAALEAMSGFSWVYNPTRLHVSYGEDGTPDSFTPHDFRVPVSRFKGTGLGVSSIISSGTEFADMLLVEGTRGCPSQCPFCLLGNTFPFVVDRLTEFASDSQDIGIVGGGVSFHPAITDVIRRLKRMGKRVHLPSLRMDEIPLSVIELMRDDIKTFTFGLEAGTERLRRFAGKPLSDEEILDRMDAIMDINSFHVKLYFMIGLYGETRDDIDAVGELTKRIKHIMVKRGAKRGTLGSITVHTSPFVPKPATPFQWLPMEETAVLKEKIVSLKRAFSKIDNTYFTHESVKHSALQGILARGDRRLAGTIVRLAGGDSYAKILREGPLNLSFYSSRMRGREEIFPWDFVGEKNRKESLYRCLASSLSAVGLPSPE